MEDQGANMLRRMFCGTLPLVSLLVFASVLATPAQPQNPSTAAGASPDLSGMFTFLREGEFVQLSVEDGQLTGFVSRFGDTDDDKGTFIDQFFDKASVQGDHVTFKTKTIHAVWYEFDGTVTTVAGKQKGEEGYRVMRGQAHAAQGRRTWQRPGQRTHCRVPGIPRRGTHAKPVIRPTLFRDT